MARTGRPKSGTLEDQIINSQNRIEKLTEKLKEEKRKLADLQTRKKMRDQKAIMDAFETSGYTLEEIQEVLEARKNK